MGGFEEQMLIIMAPIFRICPGVRDPRPPCFRGRFRERVREKEGGAEGERQGGGEISRPRNQCPLILFC